MNDRILYSAGLPLALAALLVTAPLTAQTERKITQLADGVYEIQHKDSQDGLTSGNTTVILGERQVFVVDSCFRPSDAREDIEQIRKWTDKPVSFVLNTHFHNDHNFGNAVYMQAFPALTIIAHVETKKDMDRYGPSSARRTEKGTVNIQQMLDTGKTKSGQQLDADDISYLKDALGKRTPVVNEMKQLKFQSATLAFDHDFTLDIGGREVQVKFLGRGNTTGDAVVYLPKERIVVAGDLVVHPIPYTYDGYPPEWIETLDRLAALDAVAIVPGHGPVLHDETYVLLVRDLLKSAVDQLNAKLVEVGPAVAQTLDDVKGSVDLTPFRQRFAGDDKDLGREFDDMAKNLIKVTFAEASLR